MSVHEQPSTSTAPQTNGLALAGMICGIIAVTTFWVPIAYLVSSLAGGIVAVVLNHRARSATARGAGRARLRVHRHRAVHRQRCCRGDHLLFLIGPPALPSARDRRHAGSQQGDRRRRDGGGRRACPRGAVDRRGEAAPVRGRRGDALRGAAVLVGRVLDRRHGVRARPPWNGRVAVRYRPGPGRPGAAPAVRVRRPAPRRPGCRTPGRGGRGRAGLRARAVLRLALAGGRAGSPVGLGAVGTSRPGPSRAPCCSGSWRSSRWSTPSAGPAQAGGGGPTRPARRATEDVDPHPGPRGRPTAGGYLRRGGRGPPPGSGGARWGRRP